jgi:hypothetical protein
MGGTYFHSLNCVEKKFDDRTVTLSPVLVTGETAQMMLPDIAQNNTPQGRIGQKAYIWEIQFQGQFVLEEATAPTVKGTIVKYAIVIDKQSRGDTPTWLQVFETANENSYRNLEYANRFGVLKAGTFAINRPNGVATSEVYPEATRRISYYKKFKNPLRIDYTTAGTTGASGEVLRNNIWILLYSKNSASNTTSFRS